MTTVDVQLRLRAADVTTARVWLHRHGVRPVGSQCPDGPGRPVNLYRRLDVLRALLVDAERTRVRCEALVTRLDRRYGPPPRST